MSEIPQQTFNLNNLIHAMCDFKHLLNQPVINENLSIYIDGTIEISGETFNNLDYFMKLVNNNNELQLDLYNNNMRKFD